MDKKARLLTEIETKFLKEKKSIPKEQQGILKKRIIERLVFLKSKEILNAMKLISEEEREIILNNLIKSLYPLTLKNFINKYKKILDETEKKSKKTFSIELPFEEYTHLLNGIKIVKNKIKVEKEFEKLFNKPEFITNRKIHADVRYIKKLRVRRELFEFLKERKNQIKIKNILEGHLNFKYSLIEFYERGIILLKSVTKEDFLKKCNELVLKKEYKEMESDYLDYEIFPFDIGDNYEDLYVRINPLYKKINLKYQKEIKS